MFGGGRATQKQAPREFYTEVGHRSFHTVWTRSRQTPDKMLRALDRSRPPNPSTCRWIGAVLRLKSARSLNPASHPGSTWLEGRTVKPVERSRAPNVRPDCAHNAQGGIHGSHHPTQASQTFRNRRGGSADRRLSRHPG